MRNLVKSTAHKANTESITIADLQPRAALPQDILDSTPIAPFAALTESSPARVAATSSDHYTTGVRLAHPTPIISNAKNASEYDDVSATITLDFGVQLFEQRTTSFTVTTNGVCHTMGRY